ncbi:hypothetical protein BDF20DRAFT_13182 [Mycotypha africana]|uniref:uncharacterized protein n=1 Tax=Mycotypha africana TaxID=64632 RepID=UPI0023006A05|nr:uncharacterized protein BDF20DRAFT_13182 [Mycotypha africana]KAI8990977.1 hypothetical protein BDF20DRAFT_13182 [Mycotypha africana]
MQCLEQHIDAREEVLEKADKTHHGLLVTKRKRSDNPEEQREEDEKDRVKRLDGEQIQIRATTKEVDQRINNFIQAKQHELDESNRTEFLNQRDPSADDITCARTDAREINRNIQMKFDIVNNEDGPLARSRTTQEEPKRPTGVDKASSTSTGADVSERLNNLQEHLNVKFDSTAKPPFSIFERIKILENTLMEIERQYPTWAAVHFHQPNRNFPPPPPVTYISRPNNQAVNNTTGMIPSQQQLHGSDKETVNNEATYLSTQITTAAPQQRVIRTQGRANSSLTRAVLDQLNRQKQISVTKQTIESSNP